MSKGMKIALSANLKYGKLSKKELLVEFSKVADCEIDEISCFTKKDLVYKLIISSLCSEIDKLNNELGGLQQTKSLKPCV